MSRYIGCTPFKDLISFVGELFHFCYSRHCLWQRPLSVRDPFYLCYCIDIVCIAASSVVDRVAFSISNRILGKNVFKIKLYIYQESIYHFIATVTNNCVHYNSVCYYFDRVVLNDSALGLSLSSPSPPSPLSPAGF